MTPRPKPQLRFEQLEDRSLPAGTMVPAGEFNWTQFSPTGSLGQLVWNGESLVYRARAGGAWTSEIVAFSDDFTKPVYHSRDEAQEASQSAQLVFAANGTPHAFFLEELYHWQTNTFQTHIRHYARAASGWRMVETITPTWRTTWGPNNLVVARGPGDSFHMVFTETNRPATEAGQFGTGRLSYATNKSGSWTFAKIADTTDLTYDVWIKGMRYAPRFLSLAVDQQGNAHVTYTPRFYISGAFGIVTSDLKYATNAGGSWTSETLIASADGTADAGLGASIAVAPNGQIAVASYYVDRYVSGSPERSWLAYSTRNAASGEWTTTTAVHAPDGYVGADGPRFTGFAPLLSFDAQSRPTIVFTDEASEHLPVSFANQLAGQIRTTTLVNGAWNTTTVFRQSNPLVNQMFFPVATTFNGLTVYAGLRATSALDADKNPVRVDFALVDVNAPGGSPPVVVPPTVPPPPPPPVSPPPPTPNHPILVSATEAGAMTVVRADYSNGSYFWWTPFGSYFTGGASVALGDVNRDGVKDIIVASGAGMPGMVRIWDGATRAPLRDLRPLGSFGGGLTVASGDVNGDGAADIVVGVAGRGSPVVTVISGATGRTIGQFLAYNSGFLGGITLAVGDVNHDGRADIAVGPAVSARAIRIIDGSTVAPGQAATDLVPRFYPFAPQYQGGVSLALGDLTGDGHADLVVGNASGVARARIYNGSALMGGGPATPQVVQDLWAYDGRGIRAACVEDVDGDDRPELVFGRRGSNVALRLLSSHLTSTGWSIDTYSWFQPMPGFASGIFVG